MGRNLWEMAVGCSRWIGWVASVWEGRGCVWEDEDMVKEVDVFGKIRIW